MGLSYVHFLIYRILCTFSYNSMWIILCTVSCCSRVYGSIIESKCLIRHFCNLISWTLLYEPYLMNLIILTDLMNLILWNVCNINLILWTLSYGDYLMVIILWSLSYCFYLVTTVQHVCRMLHRKCCTASVARCTCIRPHKRAAVPYQALLQYVPQKAENTGFRKTNCI